MTKFIIALVAAVILITVPAVLYIRKTVRKMDPEEHDDISSNFGGGDDDGM